MNEFVTGRDIHEAFLQAHREIYAQYSVSGQIKAWQNLTDAERAAYERMAALLNEKITYCVHRCVLPFFEEGTHDIPSGYGIEHSQDGGFYPYRVNSTDASLIAHLKDTSGLDVCCASRDEALRAIEAEVAR